MFRPFARSARCACNRRAVRSAQPASAMRRILAGLVALSLLLTVSCDDAEQPGPETPPAASATTAGPPSSPAPIVTGVSPTGTVTAIPAATQAPGQPSAWRNDAPAAMPNGYVFWVELGCFACDDPSAGLRRVYKTRGGQVRDDDVLPFQVRGTRGYISGMAFTPDGSDIVLAWCAGGNCGPAGQVTPGAQTTLYRSRDGGITYDLLGRFAEVYHPAALTGGRVLVAGPYRADNAPLGYRLLPGDEAVIPPPASERLYPFSGPDGSVWWSTGNGMGAVDMNGAPALTIRGSGGETLRSVLAIPGSNRLTYTAQARERIYTGIVERDGTVVREFFSAGGFTAPNVMLDERTGIGNATVTEAELGGRAPSPFVELLPALINTDVGSVVPLAPPFLDGHFRNGRNIVRAAVRGAFARVVNTASCLNLRERPDPAAPVVACAAGGVLGRVQAVAQIEQQGPWYNLRLPDGREGWASGEFLEQ